MILYDDIDEKDQMMIEVYHNILYRYLLFHYVQVHVHDDEQMEELLPMYVCFCFEY
jgi:hypothetical protein